MRQKLQTGRDRSRVQQLELNPRLRGGVVRRIVEAEWLGQTNFPVLVELLEAVIRWERHRKRLSGQARTLGPLAHQTDVDCHRFKRQHQARLDEPDHTAETALDVLRARVTQVAEDAFDGAASTE